MFVFKNIGTAQIPNFILYEDIDIPLLGLNNAPVLYHDNGKINMITGISTGGAYYLSYESCPIVGDLNENSIVDIVDIIFSVTMVGVIYCLSTELFNNRMSAIVAVVISSASAS